jgi:pyrroloquinoline quinone (PQQ) biosynthesis protein C
MSSFFLDLIDSTDEARRDFETNPKVLDIVARGLPLERYRNLLLELYHIVWHFNPVCAAAASRMTDQFRDLRYFLYEHMHDESGHELWVLNDLEAVGVPRSDALAYRPSPEVMGFVGFNYWSADRRNPCAALGMVYALEVIASVYGGPISTAIKDSLLLDSDRGITFISSHSTLDAEHMAQLRGVLNPVADREARDAIIESTSFNFAQFTRILERI